MNLIGGAGEASRQTGSSSSSSSTTSGLEATNATVWNQRAALEADETAAAAAVVGLESELRYKPIVDGHGMKRPKRTETETYVTFTHH